MKNNIKILALDLDGTTLTSRNTLSPRTKAALQRAIAGGIEVAAASGRPYGSMHKDILGFDNIEFFVTSNGAAIYNSRGKRVYQSLMNESDVIKILELTSGYDFIFEAFVNGLTCTDARYVQNPLKYGCSKAYVDYVRSSRETAADMREYIYAHRKELDSIEIVCTDKALRREIWQKISDNTENLYITSSSENFVEFMNKNATKANGLKWICSKLCVDESRVCACGNADNDADMIKLAGLGAAVKNASPLCLEYADLIVASNDDDGVAELVDYILENNK